MLAAHQFPFQIAKRVASSFDGDDWLFEIKHDGFRMLAIRDGRPTRLFTRNRYDFSQRHQEITAALDALPVERFVLDGELVVLDHDGRSNFPKLAHSRSGTHYYAFDLLLLGDTDLRGRPLEERKEALASLLKACDPVRYCDHVVGAGSAFFDAVRQAGLEGMVAKRRRSQYLGTLTEDWLKVKCLRTHDFVIGGSVPDGNGAFKVLLLGEFVDGELRYVGQIQAGSAVRVAARISRMLAPRENHLLRIKYRKPMRNSASPYCALESSTRT
jgi:bifunctional non-homologous end joining protein LigD